MEGCKVQRLGAERVVDNVRAVRGTEMVVTRAIAMCKGVTGALGMTIPSLLSAAMFTIYSLHSGRDIEAKQAAMTIVLVNVGQGQGRRRGQGQGRRRKQGQGWRRGRRRQRAAARPVPP